MTIEEQSRGREALNPGAIPQPGWRDILLRTKNRLLEDEIGFAAAGVAFYLLLSFIPLLVCIISCYGLFADVSDVRNQLVHLVGIVPSEALDLIRTELDSLTTQNNAAGLTALLSFGLSLWGGTKGYEAGMVAFNIAYNEKETRGILKRKLLAVGLTLATIVFAALLIGLLVVVPAAVAMLGMDDSSSGTLLTWLRWPVLYVLALLGFAVLTRFTPDRQSPQWQWISVGAVVAGFLWVGSCALFTFYAANIGDYSKTYGSLGAIILLIMWFYVSALVMMIGAELNAEVEHQTLRDSTVGTARPMGERGAHVADTIGTKP